MAVVLSARLMVRYVDKYDPDLASAFEKLERGLPPALAEHVERTLDVLSKAPRDERFSENVRLLTKAWAERRVVTFDYEPARYEGGAAPRRATVQPYLLEPSLQTHALYLVGFDETRGALRTFKIERIRKVALTPQTFDPPDAATTTARCDAAWDIIADQPLDEIVLRFAPAVADRVRETTWHPTQTREARSPTARSAGGVGVGHDRDPPLDPVVGRRREVLAPAALRDDVADTHRRALERTRTRTRDAMTRAPPSVRRGQPHQRPDPRLRRADQAPGTPTSPRPPGCRTRTSPRRTCSTRPGSSGCAGSASSRAPAGSFRRPSTRASRTGSGSCTRPACGRARCIRACGRRWSRPARPPRPRAWSSRRSGWPACSTTSAMARSPTSSTTRCWPRSPPRPTRGAPAASG